MNKKLFKDKEIIEKIIKVDDAENLGYEIHTNKQIVTIFISNQSGCCESWGVITTEDTLSDFIKAELLTLSTIDYDYKNHPLTKDDTFGGYDEGGCIFVDVETSKGKLQFVLYNQHNGYYGHSVTIRSNQFNEDAGV